MEVPTLFASCKFIFNLFCQGVHPSIRGEVWEFLLGCFDPRSTFDERDQLRQQRRYVFFNDLPVVILTIQVLLKNFMNLHSQMAFVSNC